MTYHLIKKLFDEYLEKNHPEIDFFDNKDIENSIKMYGRDYKSYIPYKNLYFRKKIFEYEKAQYLRKNPYIYNWTDEDCTTPEIPVEIKKQESNDKRIYKCMLDNCNRQYTSAFGLKYHMKEGHSKEKLSVYKPFICSVEGCGRKYKNNNGLKYHLKNFHDIE